MMQTIDLLTHLHIRRKVPRNLPPPASFHCLVRRAVTERKTLPARMVAVRRSDKHAEPGDKALVCVAMQRTVILSSF
jgi:hypothetical protein